MSSVSNRNATHKTTNTDSPDILAQAGAIRDERTEDGKASTEHTDFLLGIQAVRDGEDELVVRDDAGGVGILDVSGVCECRQGAIR
jgi:hypothetical protein